MGGCVLVLAFQNTDCIKSGQGFRGSLTCGSYLNNEVIATPLLMYQDF